MDDILRAFDLDGRPVHRERYGSGHINETYRVVTDRAHAYILQKINRAVFPDIPGLMRNIESVTGYLRRHEKDPRRVLTLVPTLSGGSFHVSPDGEYWRVYEFVTDSLCLDRAETAEDFRQSGAAFGQFQRQLAGFPAETLTEVIPGFHDTVNRYRLLRRALEEDRAGRVRYLEPEIEWYLSREGEAGENLDKLRKGLLPLRVTHNDTKLNNVMLDAVTRTPLCVIDLDTVMPGLAANDFGDSIRFGASTAPEDEKDLSRVLLSRDLFRAYTEGFLGACASALTPEEISSLLPGAKLMTLECGVRFLTDEINGNIYFHVNYPGQNLDRARTQMKLVKEMDRQWDDLRGIVESTAERLRRL